MLKKITLVASALSASAYAQVPSTAFTPAPPDFSATSPTYHYDGVSVNVNNFPTSAKIIYGEHPGIEALSSGIEAPSSDAVQVNSIAGYSRIQGGKTAAVGVLGTGLMSADTIAPGGAWGIDGVASNSPTAQPHANTGVNYNFVGHELDVNILALPGGGTPTGHTAAGLFINSDIEVMPSGNVAGILIDKAGAQPWSSAILLADGSANYGLWIGVSSKIGNHLGSLPIVLNSKDASGAYHQATILSDADGGIVLTPAGSRVAIDGNFQIGGVVIASAIFAQNAGTAYMDGTSFAAGTHGGQVFNAAGTLYVDSYSGPIQFRGTSYASLAQIDAAGNVSSTGYLKAGSFVRTGATTVAGLATIDPSPQAGDRTIVTDAATCSFNAAVSGGGSTKCPVVYTSSWVAG